MAHPASPQIEFLLELGRALLVTGTPANRFEETMGQVAQKLGIEAQFFAIPTGFFSYITIDGIQHTFLLRGRSDTMDLGRIGDLHEVTLQVLKDAIGLQEASERVKAIVAAPEVHPKRHLVLANALLSACVTVFLNGGWRELLLGGVLGGLVGLMIGLCRARQTLIRVLPFLGAVVAGLLSVMLCHWIPQASALVVTLGAIIVLIPSPGIVMTTNEMATDNLLAGSARGLHTLLDLGQLATGMVVAQRIGVHWFQTGMTAAPSSFPGWVQMVAMFMVAPAFVVLFNARWRDLLPMLVACVVAFGGARLAGEGLGPEFGIGFAAYLLGIGSTLWARRSGRTPFVPLLPAMVLLVPGVIGVQSFTLLGSRQVNVGLDSALQMVQVGMALLVGLLLSRVTVDPRKAVRLKAS
ncbi:threonine/serine ThrE exporter family protein [Holophaga foetida]|uniref:threonine/serine ThrE exporter family protein n=1 Tax=Holophaga foetida TaxID=35839 RepID=UPI00024717DB|nr:threonine/serine exporter family protein [Holophaga foetida]